MHLIVQLTSSTLAYPLSSLTTSTDMIIVGVRLSYNLSYKDYDDHNKKKEQKATNKNTLPYFT